MLFLENKVAQVDKLPNGLPVARRFYFGVAVPARSGLCTGVVGTEFGGVSVYDVAPVPHTGPAGVAWKGGATVEIRTLPVPEIP